MLNNPETVLARHLEMEARMAAGNPPEVVERAKETHATFFNFKKWLSEREETAAREQAAEVTSGSGWNGLKSSRRSRNGSRNGSHGQVGQAFQPDVSLERLTYPRVISVRTCHRITRDPLADVDVKGHLSYLRGLLDALDRWTVLAELNLRLVTFHLRESTPCDKMWRPGRYRLTCEDNPSLSWLARHWELKPDGALSIKGTEATNAV